MKLSEPIELDKSLMTYSACASALPIPMKQSHISPSIAAVGAEASKSPDKSGL